MLRSLNEYCENTDYVLFFLFWKILLLLLLLRKNSVRVCHAFYIVYLTAHHLLVLLRLLEKELYFSSRFFSYQITSRLIF